MNVFFFSPPHIYKLTFPTSRQRIHTRPVVSCCPRGLDFPVSNEHERVLASQLTRGPDSAARREAEEEWRALAGLRCHGSRHKLGHRERERERVRLWKPGCLHGNRGVDKPLPPRLGKYSTARKRRVLLCAGWIIKSERG